MRDAPRHQTETLDVLLVTVSKRGCQAFGLPPLQLLYLAPEKIDRLQQFTFLPFQFSFA